MMHIHTKYKIAYLALMIALSMIFSYVELLIPINFGIPGIKLGLANVVSVVVLYLFGFYSTIIVVLARVLLSGFMFGNMFSIIYSLSGGIISVLVMALFKKSRMFSVLGVSMAGGVFHNLAQLLIAIIIVEQLKIYYYGPILIVSGLIMGTIIGYISSMIIKRVETYVRL